MQLSKLSDLEGSDGRKIRNNLWKPDLKPGENPRGTAVFLPGYQYPPEAPLFFYLQGVLVDQGWSVLSIDYRYSENSAYTALGTAEKAEYVRNDAKSMLPAIIRCAGHGNVCFAAKSLGTSLLYHMVRSSLDYFSNELRQCIWMTPAGDHSEIVKLLVEHNIRSAYVIGTADSFYKPALIKTLSGLAHVRTLVQPNAGHSLEKKGDLVESIENLEHAVSFFDSFIFG